jgi:hypothetical protein
VTCPECGKAATSRFHGTYDTGCLDCCVRLVASARPSRRHQEAMLYALERIPGSPGRDEIINFLKEKAIEK